MRAFRVAAMMVLLTGPAYAQIPQLNLLQDTTPPKTDEQIEQERAKDQAYKESLKKIPDAKGSNDPWGGVRTDAAKTPPAKTTTATKAKTKTSSAPN